jgi:hypothetical protein
MNRIILFVAVSHQALGESARVGGSVDCSSGYWCSAKDMEIVGTIDSLTVEKFKHLIDSVHERAARERKDVQLTHISLGLNSPGGGVAAAMAIGRILRKERLDVIVPFDGECYSACVLVFAGAVWRMNAGRLPHLSAKSRNRARLLSGHSHVRNSCPAELSHDDVDLLHDWKGGLRRLRGALLAYKRALCCLNNFIQAGAATPQHHRAGAGSALRLLYGAQSSQPRPDRGASIRIILYFDFKRQI